MRAAVPWVLTALGAFVALCLALSLREKDYYDHGSLTAVAGDPASDPAVHLLLPPDVRHSCPTCGECVHPVEVVEHRRTLSLRDRDGWYKLFWAGDETYYFEELQHLAACYENRTAEHPHGVWTIRVNVGPAGHAKGTPHPCGAIPQEMQFRYDLVVAEGAEDSAGQADLGIQALVYRYDGEKLPPTLRFGWSLSERQTTPASPVPCPCGQP